MKILNLYAGIGGNRKLWGDKHDITAIESNVDIAHAYRQMYRKDKVFVTDAHEFLINHFKEYDFIWSSPPCPSHSRVNLALQGHGIYRYPDMGLYQEIIFLQRFFKGDWVVENVIPYYKPLVEPTVELARHLFWSNLEIPKREFDKHPDVTRSKKEDLAKYHGIELPPKTKDQRKLLRNAVNPQVGKYILELSKFNDKYKED